MSTSVGGAGVDRKEDGERRVLGVKAGVTILRFEDPLLLCTFPS